MASSKLFTVFVQPSSSCLELLRYLNKNILTVNKMGVKVQIEKLEKEDCDKEMVDALNKRGINRLPAMVASDGKTFVGLKSILDLFEKGIGSHQRDNRLNGGGMDLDTSPEQDTSFGTNPDMANFWMTELFAGIDKKGKHIPRKDKDEAEDEGDDIEKKMRAYERNIPKHRKGNSERDVDNTMAEQQTRRRRRPAPTRRRQQDDDEEPDNIASDDDESGGYDDAPRRNNRQDNPPFAPSADVGGDDMDQKMLSAWLNNNPAEY
jgi:hypothetical protein